MSTESEAKSCPKCGAAIPPEAPQGLCPKCLLMQASLPTEADGLKNPSAKSTPPSREELSVAFPQLEILELIGQGGMGFVFKARQPKLERFVALKILPQSLATDPAFAERFSREGKMLARLSHPNIVTVHDFGQAGPFFYLLMEYVDGVNLRQAMKAGRFTPEQALAVVPKICEALQFAHNDGILHRDIKPENILLDAKGRVKIADFGIAKLIGPSQYGVLPAGGASSTPPKSSDSTAASLTEVGKVFGTPQYMAPEQMERPEQVDQRADIYSVGVVFYEMLTGELPAKRLEPPSHKVQVDVRLDEVVLRALEQKPELRYQQASVFQTQVETIANTPASEATPSRSEPWRNYKSKQTIFGVPLVHVTWEKDPETNRPRIAKGIVAVGPTAVGIIAVGFEAYGVFPAGLLACGVAPVGLGALGVAAVGILAAGLQATGLLCAARWATAVHNFGFTTNALVASAAIAFLMSQLIRMIVHAAFDSTEPPKTSASQGTTVHFARKKKKGEFIGIGCGIQTIGLLCFFIPGIGFILGILLLILGGQMAVKSVCSHCGHSNSRDAVQCKKCGSQFENSAGIFSSSSRGEIGDPFWKRFAVSVIIVVMALILIPVSAIILAIALPAYQRAHARPHPEGTVAHVSESMPHEPAASLENWSPTLEAGQKPDLLKILESISQLTDRGEYEQALQHCLWFFNHALDPGMSGVRLSSCLSAWVELGRRYPKARQALIEIRDRDAKEFQEGRGYSKLFQDLACINSQLQQDDATYALYKTLHTKDPELARECYFYAEKLLAEKGEYQICFDYMGDPQVRFELIQKSYEMEQGNLQRMQEMEANGTPGTATFTSRLNQKMGYTNMAFPAPPLRLAPRPDLSRIMKKSAEDRFVGSVRQLIQILVGTKHETEAEQIRTQALAVLKDPRIDSAVRDAANVVIK